MKLVGFLSLFLLSFVSKGQTNLLFHNVDTLKAEFRAGGKLNDSLDLYFAEKQTTLPGGTQNNPFGTNGNDYFNFFQSLPKQYRTYKIAGPVFTALPHLGFMYSFGSGGLQYLHTEYQQTLRGNIHLSMHYNRQVSTTLYKQSDFSSDAFAISLSRYGKKWNHLVEGTASNSLRNLNGGVTNDDKMLSQYSLVYTPVLKNNALDSSKRYLLHHQSVWNFLKKDSLSKIETGLTFNNVLRVDQRIYREADTISKIYPFFNNPNFTRDLSQLSYLENGLGYFFKSKINTTEVGINRVYWIYKTNAAQVKNEINMTLSSKWKFVKTTVSYDFMQNLVGQANQFSHNATIINSLEKYSNSFEIGYSQLVPEPFQRLYFGNTIGWKMPVIQKQSLTSMLYTFSGKWKLKPQLKVGYKQMNNTYFFIHDQWRNDTLSQIQQFYISASCNLNVGNFYLQPIITLNHLNDATNLVPKFDVRGRLLWKKKLRGKDSYELLIGTDVYAKSSYSLLSFDSRISAFSIINPNAKMYNSVVQLDAFVGISIDEMRFYFKYENIDNAWNNRTNRIVNGYPVMPKILRIGLTWDFLN